MEYLRVETKPQISFPISVNIENLDKWLSDPRFIQVKQDAQGKELVLFLGTTGAGKSTCINYLLGAKLDKEQDIDLTLAVLSDDQNAWLPTKKLPEIGNKFYASCTSYSEIFDDESNGLAYCDTAGFMDTRRAESELHVCASLSMQLAIQSAKTIKAIVVVIEWETFRQRICTVLEALMYTLSQLLIEPECIADSIIFLINKAPLKVKKEDFFTVVSEYQEVLKKDIEAFTKNQKANLVSLELQSLKAIDCMLDLLGSHIKVRPQNIILIDVFDEGQNRKIIHALLNEKKTVIAKENFNFKEYNQQRKIFESEIKIIVPLMKASRKNKLDQKKKQKKEITPKNEIGMQTPFDAPAFEGKKQASAVPHNVEPFVSVHTENLSEKPNTNSRLNTTEILIPNDEATNAKTVIVSTVPTIVLKNNNSQIIDNKIPEKCVSVIHNDNPEENQHDITDIVLSLVQTPEAQKKPIRTAENKNLGYNPDIQPTEVLSNPDNINEKNEVTQTDGEVSSHIDLTKIIRTCAQLGGAAIGLFGLFLLGTGIGALAHGTLAVSIVEAVFNMALDDSMACAFVYGLFCLFLSATIFYVTHVFANNSSHTTNSSNVLEDVTNDNGYGTFEEPTHMQKNSIELPRAQNSSAQQNQTVCRPNVIGLLETNGQVKNF